MKAKTIMPRINRDNDQLAAMRSITTVLTQRTVADLQQAMAYSCVPDETVTNTCCLVNMLNETITQLSYYDRLAVIDFLGAVAETLRQGEMTDDIIAAVHGAQERLTRSELRQLCAADARGTA